MLGWDGERVRRVAAYLGANLFRCRTLLSLFAFLISYILAIHQFSANIDAKFSPRQSAAAIVFLAGVLLIGAIHFVVSHIHLYRLRARADHANVIVPLAQM